MCWNVFEEMRVAVVGGMLKERAKEEIAASESVIVHLRARDRTVCQ